MNELETEIVKLEKERKRLLKEYYVNGKTENEEVDKIVIFLETIISKLKEIAEKAE